MTGSIRWVKTLDDAGEWVDTPCYLLGGAVVTEGVYRQAFPDQPLYVGVPPGGDTGSVGYPILSDALGVHPDQIPEAREHYRKRGVSVDFAPDGRLVMADSAHRKRVLRAAGVHDRNSYNGH